MSNRELPQFKTFEQLNMPANVYDGLLAVLDDLKNDRLKHILLEDLYELPHHEQIKMEVFNMNRWDTECGTPACIGGWLRKKINDNQFPINPELALLFYPENIEDWDLITPLQAAGAIENYLETGNVDWSKVIPESNWVTAEV